MDKDTCLLPEQFKEIDCILVDESQFLPPQTIDELRVLTFRPGVPVICYGLRTDFRTKLFPGSKRLLELADRIEEVKVTCQFCRKKATFNQRFVGGKAVSEGPQIQLGADESYAPVCWEHYEKNISDSKADLSTTSNIGNGKKAVENSPIL